MDNMDISEHTMVKAIKANLFEYYDYLGRSPKAELIESRELKLLITGIPHPFLNNVLRTQLMSSNVDARIEEVLGYFHSKGIPDFSWWVEPDSQPPDLNRHLISHGLAFEDDEPGMACNLFKMNEGVTTSPELTIEYVQDPATLKQWVQVAISGFGFPENLAQPCFNLFTSLGFDLPLRLYIGFLNRVPVVCSQLFLGAGVAGIYWVATVPEARRQGLGAAITLAPLREARDMGYTLGILHSSEMGYRVYQGIGFQKLCKMNHFVARADSK
jgi:GNAT superfamily N-acetyltransferase